MKEWQVDYTTLGTRVTDFGIKAETADDAIAFVIKRVGKQAVIQSVKEYAPSPFSLAVLSQLNESPSLGLKYLFLISMGVDVSR